MVIARQVYEVWPGGRLRILCPATSRDCLESRRLLSGNAELNKDFSGIRVAQGKIEDVAERNPSIRENIPDRHMPHSGSGETPNLVVKETN
jgi:hypothetical protein